MLFYKKNKNYNIYKIRDIPYDVPTELTFYGLSVYSLIMKTSF